MKPVIALLTDFGAKGQHYVASMKGVILKICSDANIIDISHDVKSYSILEASYLIESTYSHFPEGSIFVAVVDPGVGSSRGIIALKSKSNHIFIGPDNGIFPLIFNVEDINECFLIQNTQYFNKPVSKTFHGRDIMAPIGAHILNGVSLEKLGPSSNFEDLKTHPITFRVKSEKKKIYSTVQYVDSFGNGTTNIKLNEDLITGTDFKLPVDAIIMLRFKNQTFVGKFTSHFDSVPIDALLFLKGSSNYLEISINQGSAAEIIGFTVGDVVQIQL